MYSKGANVDALRDSAGRMASYGREVDLVRARGQRAVSAMQGAWRGPDMAHLAERWRRVEHDLVRISADFDDLSRRLHRNAERQQRSSGVPAGGGHGDHGGRGGHGGPGHGGGSGDGSGHGGSGDHGGGAGHGGSGRGSGSGAGSGHGGSGGSEAHLVQSGHGGGSGAGHEGVRPGGHGAHGAVFEAVGGPVVGSAGHGGLDVAWLGSDGGRPVVHDALLAPWSAGTGGRPLVGDVLAPWLGPDGGRPLVDGWSAPQVWHGSASGHWIGMPAHHGPAHGELVLQSDLAPVRHPGHAAFVAHQLGLPIR